MNDYEVIVIGAGPVGSWAAYRLASSGHRVTVFEKYEAAGHKRCCTGIIGRECFETFAIDPACVQREARSAKLFAPGGEFLRVSRPEPQACIVDRAAFDRSLARRAQTAGAEYRFSAEVSDIRIAPGGIEVSIHPEGVRYSASAIVIASGFGSKLTERVGLGSIRSFIMGAQTEVGIRGIEEVEVYFGRRIAPGFFGWLVPVSEGVGRLGLFARENPGTYLKELMGRLAAEGKIIPSESPPSFGGIPLRTLRRTFGDRVLVAGDAAGHVKPTTGGGIYYGMLAADMAAETLHGALVRGDLSARGLAAYERRWKERLGRELRIDSFARALFNRLSDRQLDALFRVVQDNALHEAVMASAYRSFDWHGELILDGLKRLRPWQSLFTRYLPAYILSALKSRRP